MAEIIGTKENPYHLSVGIVVKDDSKVILIHKKQKKYTVPSETISLNETLEEAVKRGAREELGLLVEIEKYLGGMIFTFKRADETEINKTTCYFLVRKVGECEKTPMDDELLDEVHWFEIAEAISVLEKEGNVQAEILKRIYGKNN